MGIEWLQVPDPPAAESLCCVFEYRQLIRMKTGNRPDITKIVDLDPIYHQKHAMPFIQNLFAFL